MKSADQIVAELQAVVVRQLGDRAGTFKVAAVDEELSKARQAARAMLTAEDRALIKEALDQFRSWVIGRDEEAFERVATGGRPPQDIEVAVRVAEDAAIGLVAVDLDPSIRDALGQRLATIKVETVAERTLSSRPPLKFTDKNVQMMVAGLIVIFATAAVASVLGPEADSDSSLTAGGLVSAIGLFAGAVIFVLAFRRWRSGAVVSNVASTSSFRGGAMGRKKNQSL